MKQSNYINDLCVDRKSAYEIDLELKIRKWIESITPYQYEIHKNDDKYGYDISIYKYFLDSENYDKKLIAYIEIEVSEKWQNEYPANWKDISYLARKIYKYDYSIDIFTNELKDDADKTLYVIFNKELSDCHCQEIEIISNFELKRRGLQGLDNYRDTYLTVSIKDRHRVIWGKKNVGSKIKEFIDKKSTLTQINEFSESTGGDIPEFSESNYADGTLPF